MHLLIGPVGSGKSTYALRLAADRRAVHLDLDDWMVRLFRADRPESGVVEWYAQRAERCVAQIWSLAQAMANAGCEVVLEIGMLSRSERERFYAWVDEAAVDLRVLVLDAPRELRRERIERRNREQGETFSMVVSPEIFEFASDLWEAPLMDEIEERSITAIAAT